MHAIICSFIDIYLSTYKVQGPVLGAGNFEKRRMPVLPAEISALPSVLQKLVWEAK